MARPPELTVKDWISLYELLRSAKAQDPEAMCEDLASVLLTTLSVEHHPELYHLDGNKLYDVAGNRFAYGLSTDALKKGKMTSVDLERCSDQQKLATALEFSK
ncbi:hypothetical protein [Citrobacter braakii]|uniref:hypothetical protein n=1 Tax=Citrobacter braakii TaxID=57706 RepID=UPI001BCC5CF7|nr:hypothetical protein [Citrobacter braakii]